MTDFNPFDPENFTIGVGWDGKLVTITASKFEVDYFKFGDGTPWLDDKGEPGYANVWALSGITEDSDRERTEKYSIGKTLIPSSDGESFEHRDNKPNATFNARSHAAKLVGHLKDAGFDLSKLVKDGRPTASGLVGAMFTFKAFPVMKDGVHVEDKGGFKKYDFYPVKFEGFNASVSSTNAASVESETKDRAYDIITGLLGEAEGNTLTRVQLIQALNKKLDGDPEMSAIMTLAVKDDFNDKAPWKVEGTTISL